MDWYVVQVHYPLLKPENADLLEAFVTPDQRVRLWMEAADRKVKRYRGPKLTCLANRVWVPERRVLYLDFCRRLGTVNIETDGGVVQTNTSNWALCPLIYFADSQVVAIAHNPDVWRNRALTGLAGHLGLLLKSARDYLPESTPYSVVLEPKGRRRSFVEFLSRVSSVKSLELNLVGPNISSLRLGELLEGWRRWVDGVERAKASLSGNLDIGPNKRLEIDEVQRQGGGQVKATGVNKDTRRIDQYNSHSEDVAARVTTEDAPSAEQAADARLDEELRQKLVDLEALALPIQPSDGPAM